MGYCIKDGKTAYSDKSTCQSQGGSWVEDKPSEKKAAEFLGENSDPLGWIAENPVDAAMWATMAIPPLAGLRAGGIGLWGLIKAMGGFAGKKKLSKTGKFLKDKTDKIYRTKHKSGTVQVRDKPTKFYPKGIDKKTGKGIPERNALGQLAKQPTRGTHQTYPTHYGRPSTSKLASLMGGGVGGGLYFGSNQRKDALALEAQGIKDAEAKVLADKAAAKAEKEKQLAADAEKARPKGLMEMMGQTGYWMDPMSNLPSDTRLGRIGVLLDYLGKGPTGRQASTHPDEIFSERDIASAKIAQDNLDAFVKAQGDMGNVIGKISVSNLADGLYDRVFAVMGGDSYVPFSDPGKEEAKRASKEVAVEVARLVGEGHTNPTTGQRFDISSATEYVLGMLED